jgi:hypothetical protein
MTIDAVVAVGLDPSTLVGVVTIFEADDTVYAVARVGAYVPALDAPAISVSARPATLEVAARPATIEASGRPSWVEADTAVRSLNPTAEAVT